VEHDEVAAEAIDRAQAREESEVREDGDEPQRFVPWIARGSAAAGWAVRR
jgi:hypothetical protein